MLEPATAAVAQPQRIQTRAPLFKRPPAKPLIEESLPFTVRLVRNAQDLEKAVQIRYLAYARHLPDFAASLKRPEPADNEEGVAILLAESKLDGSPLGTMRIQTNEFGPLCLEQSVTLPESLRTQRLAEATRLGVSSERGGRLVTTVIFKAFFMYCQQNGIDEMVVTGRAPVDRTYDRLLFKDVFPGAGYLPIRHVGNLAHRVMSFEVDTARDRWAQAQHPLEDFMCRTHHRDIQLTHDDRDLEYGAPVRHGFFEPVSAIRM